MTGENTAIGHLPSRRFRLRGQKETARMLSQTGG